MGDDETNVAPEESPFRDTDPASLLATGHWPAGRRSRQLGLMVPIAEESAFGGTPRFADMREITRVADEVGFDAAWFADHLILQRQP